LKVREIEAQFFFLSFVFIFQEKRKDCSDAEFKPLTCDERNMVMEDHHYEEVSFTEI
jgi:Fe-S-cluster containining protein